MISLSAGVLTVVLGLSLSPKIGRVGLEFESKNCPSPNGPRSSRMKTVWFVGIFTLFYSLQLECNGNLNM